VLDELAACNKVVAGIVLDISRLGGREEQPTPSKPPLSSSSYISAQDVLFLPDRLGGSCLFAITEPYKSSYL
jgi:hypothetical protein